MYVLQVINDQTLGFKHPIIAEKNPVKNFVYYNNPVLSIRFTTICVSDQAITLNISTFCIIRNSFQPLEPGW